MRAIFGAVPGVVGPWGSGFVLGVAAGVALSFGKKLTWNGEVTGGNILQAAATVVCATFVASYLQRISSDRTQRKKLLLDQCDYVRQAIDGLEEISGMREERLLAVCRKLKKFSRLIQGVKKAVVVFRCPEAVAVASDMEVGLKELRLAATFTPASAAEEFASRAECPIEVRDDIIRWSSERSSEIDQSLEALRSKYFELVRCVIEA